MTKHKTTTEFGLTIPLKSLAEVRFNSPSVSSINDQNLKEFILKQISEVYFKCGIETNGEELTALTIAFLNELKMFPYLTIKEINKAFNEGYKERYGKYYGLSIKTFVQWLDYYIQNERNKDLNRLKEKKQAMSQISEREKQFYIHSGLTKCFQHYESKSSILDGYSTFMYQVFFDDGFLPKDAKTKTKFYDDAVIVLYNELVTAKPKSSAEHKQNKLDLEDIKKPKSIKVIAKAQEMIVMKFLRDTYKDEKSVIELKKKYNIE